MSEQFQLGHYLVDKTLGNGSYGKVKLAVNMKSNQKVALKFIHKSSIKKPAHMVRIKREIRLLKLLHHPNIVKFYEVAETSQDIILTMEYAGGGELFDYIVAQNYLKEPEARKIFRQIVSALDYCHQNFVIHRDLKPENLLLSEDKCIKIIDFGFANLFNPQATMGTFCGSPFYASPEMILGTKYVGPEIDIWSLGVILFVILSGQLPFDDSNVKKLYHKIVQGTFTIPEMVSPLASDLIQNMIVVDPKKRCTLQFIKSHPWTNEGCEQVVDSFIQPREKITQVDESLLSKVVMYGFELEDARAQVLKGEPSPALAIYHLLNERAKRMEKEKEKEESASAATTSAGPEGETLQSQLGPAPELDSSFTTTNPTASMANGTVSTSASTAKPPEKQTSPQPSPPAPEAEKYPKVLRRRTLAGETLAKDFPTPAVAKKAEPNAPIAASVSPPEPSKKSDASNMILPPIAPNVGQITSDKSKTPKEEEKKSGIARRFTLGAEGKKKTKEETAEEGKLRSVKGLFNVATSTSKPVPEIMELVSQVLQKNGIHFNLSGYVFCCKDESSQSPVEFEIEVCKIYKLNLHGLHLRRTKGEAWIYKNVCSKLGTQWKL